MLFLTIFLIFNKILNIASIQCLNGSITIFGGEVALQPIQQINCSSNNFCYNSYSNNGDTLLLNFNCDATNGKCKNTGCFIDNSSILYDTRICCCNADFCNNLTSPIRRNFSSNFMFGVATAAYQVEGGAFADGKGISIWDTYTHIPGTIANNETGDVSCNSYELYPTDIQNIKYMGLNHYRFSFSWPRMFPNGRTDTPNPLGIEYYDKLVNLCIANGIEPVVTLFHWDLPQSLQDIGGFLNPDIKYYFGNYSRFVFGHFGDRVKKWVTLNEPTNMAKAMYCGDGNALAPGEFRPHCAWTLYLSAHNMLLSHLAAGSIYKNEFQATQKGIIGLSLDGPWIEPYKNWPNNSDAAQREFAFGIDWLGHPIYSPEGDYPDIVKQRIANASKSEKRATSRLPVFTQDEIDGLKNSADFIGCNYYGGTQAIDLPPEQASDVRTAQSTRDSGSRDVKDEDWTQVNNPKTWIYYTPWTLRELLNFYKNNYGGKPIFITENGCMEYDNEESLNDTGRINYMKGYLSAIAAAIEDGCNIIGYTHWSIMDNFEWLTGYTNKFGLYYVNFTDPNRQRIPKASVEFYRNVVAQRYIDGF